MSKKLSNNINYFEGYNMLAIVSHLKDYTLCYHINNNLGFDLAKYEDLIFVTTPGNENSFSWYYFEDNISRTTYYLIANKNEGGILVPSQKKVDYLLLIKNPTGNDVAKNTANRLRKTPYISAAFDLNMETTKGIDLLLELIELHELEFVNKAKE